MLYTPEILAIMFGYQPPNDDTTPKYRAVGMARDTFEKDLTVILADLEAMESAPPATDGYGDGYVALPGQHVRPRLRICDQRRGSSVRPDGSPLASSDRRRDLRPDVGE